MEWLYKANDSMLDRLSTKQLAVTDGFLCRSAHNVDGSRAANVANVDFGDRVHFYFIERGKPHTLGSFEVIQKDDHPHPEWFGDQVVDTALFSVTIADFVRRRDKAGAYEEDIVLKAITGWLLAKTDEPPPPYRVSLFPGPSTLVKYEARGA